MNELSVAADIADLARIDGMPLLAEAGPGLTLDEVAADAALLDAWLNGEAAAADQMDPRTRAASLLGHLGWAACCWVAALRLRRGLGVGRLGFTQALYSWSARQRSGRTARYTVTLELASSSEVSTDIEDLFAPLVAALMVRTGLSSGAQWRIVADSLAQAHLFVGQALGRTDESLAVARDLLAQGRLFNGRTGFVRVESGSRSRWFVSRGGCCRLYLLPGGEVCAACVLREPAEQIALFRQFVSP